MAKLKGKALELWCQQWEQADHTEKLEMAEEAGIAYESARHWYSDAPMEYKNTSKEPLKAITVDELLESRPAINMDFVFFDIETSGFDADWDIMLTACIKPFGQPAKVFRADEYPTWAINRANDKLIVTDVAAELAKHAIVVGHYSSKFDVRFLRAKMFRHDLPVLPPMFGLDSWRIALNNFKMSSRRLGSIAMLARVDEKEPVESDRWMRAAFSGEKAAMDAIVEHNITDVRVLEKITCLIFPYLKSIPKL